MCSPLFLCSGAAAPTHNDQQREGGRVQLTKARNGPDGRGSCFLFETPLCVITLLTDEINIISMHTV